MNLTRRLVSLLLALILALSGVCSVSAEAVQTRTFTDSLGRTVTVPAEITRVAAAGQLAQIALLALCPEKLAGIASAWDPDAAQYLNAAFRELPYLGQLYGGKGELNPEALLASGAEIVIDVGEPKGSAAEDLDALSAQTGIPFIHITATTGTAGEAFRLLGALLDMPREAEELAAYCEKAYAKARALADRAEKVSVLYLLGDAGLNVIARGSYHAEAIDLMCNNLAAVENPSSKGTGNEVDLEQIMLWDPDVILFAPGSIYASVGSMEEWQTVSAIAGGRYYEVPCGPYNWMGFPPSVQRYLGMLWMGRLLYPDLADYDLEEEAVTFYKLFYHCELTHAQYEALLARSLGA